MAMYRVRMETYTTYVVEAESEDAAIKAVVDEPGQKEESFDIEDFTAWKIGD